MLSLEMQMNHNDRDVLFYSKIIYIFLFTPKVGSEKINMITVTVVDKQQL